MKFIWPVLSHSWIMGSQEEKWSPKSTLLQVLVSIQSMILIEAPYYNECVLINILNFIQLYSFNFAFDVILDLGMGKPI